MYTARHITLFQGGNHDGLQADGQELFGEGYTFTKVYNAFENGELRIIAKDERGFEHRYILVDGKLIEKP